MECFGKFEEHHIPPNLSLSIKREMTRRKRVKKRNLHEVNEYFERVYNEVRPASAKDR